MASISNVEKSKRGRPAVESTAITLRFPDQQLARIDDWCRAQPDMPSRTEAIRRLADQALSGGTLADPAAVAAAYIESVWAQVFAEFERDKNDAISADLVEKARLKTTADNIEDLLLPFVVHQWEAVAQRLAKQQRKSRGRKPG